MSRMLPELGVRGGRPCPPKDHLYLTAIVETGDMIPIGTVAIYQECCEKLGDICPLKIELVPTSKPNSIGFIKKMMDHQKLTQERSARSSRISSGKILPKLRCQHL